ncbi:hypothetical protein ES703_43891 [subsurface metagenome]
MYSIPPNPAADHYDKIAALRVLKALVFVHYANIATIDQRISQVPFVKVNRTIDCRYSHPVAIVPHAGHNTFHNSPRVQNTSGYILEFLVGRAKAEYICVGDGFCPQACPHWVANYAANTCS